MFLSTHINDFLGFCKSLEIDDEDVMCILFTLTLEFRFYQWCYTLPSSSIHSFRQFTKELHQDFDWYDYRDVHKRINQLGMELDESVEGFSNRFLHLCYEFPEEDVDQNFCKQNFEHLVWISLN